MNVHILFFLSIVNISFKNQAFLKERKIFIF